MAQARPTDVFPLNAEEACGLALSGLLQVVLPPLEDARNKPAEVELPEKKAAQQLHFEFI